MTQRMLSVSLDACKHSFPEHQAPHAQLRKEGKRSMMPRADLSCAWRFYVNHGKKMVYYLVRGDGLPAILMLNCAQCSSKTE